MEVLHEETTGRRDIALYNRDPQVVVSLAPQELFIDPSFTYRLDLNGPACDETELPWRVRPAQAGDAPALQRIYQRGACGADPGIPRAPG